MTRPTTIAAALVIALTGVAVAPAAQLAAQESGPRAGAQANRPPREPQRLLRTIIDATLNERTAEILSISGDTIELRDASGRVETLPLSRIVAVAPPLPSVDPEASAASRAPRAIREVRVPAAGVAPLPGRIDLADGQSMPGALIYASAGPPGAAESLRWDNPLLGRLDLPLEQLSRLVLLPDVLPATDVEADPAQDVVVLANTDVLRGFVVSIDETLELEAAPGNVVSLPIDRIARVVFANASAPARGLRVWMTDESRLSLRSLAQSPRQVLTIAPELAAPSATQPSGVLPSPLSTMDAGSVLAIAFDAARLAPLSLRAATVEGPGEGRRWTPAPFASADAPLDAPDIRLPGPITLRFDLPPGAQRVAFTLDLPPGSRIWGDCELELETISAGGQTAPLAKARVSGAAPRTFVNAALPPGTRSLRLRLVEGESGPIQDRVILRRPLVLLKP